jgi:hypothetical protein
MNLQESLDLKKLIAGFHDEYQDNTEYIRNVKHSDAIRNDIDRLIKLKRDNLQVLKTSLNKFIEMAQVEAFFLFKNYTDIFNKVIKDELDMDIMDQTLIVLKQIEDGEVDQNEASVRVGKLLKDLYVDSALKLGVKLDAENPKENKKEGRSIDWKSWKNSGCIERRNDILEKLQNPKI